MADTQGHDLSGIVYTAGQDHQNNKLAIIVSKWNPTITGVLYKGALSTLEAAGVDPNNIDKFDVPGTFELPLGAQMALANDKYDGVICIGCVIQGETRHFDFICDAVSHGITRVGLDYNKPVIFGVLTPDTDQQAADRAGGKYGNKGQEAAVALLEMLDLSRQA